MFLHSTAVLFKFGQGIKGSLHIFQIFYFDCAVFTAGNGIYGSFDIGSQVSEVGISVIAKKVVLIPNHKLLLFNFFFKILFIDFG